MCLKGNIQALRRSKFAKFSKSLAHPRPFGWVTHSFGSQKNSYPFSSPYFVPCLEVNMGNYCLLYIEITHEVAGNKGMELGRLYKIKQEQVGEGISLLISVLIFIN